MTDFHTAGRRACAATGAGELKQVARFTVTGIAATLFNLFLLWLLTAKLGIWYLTASGLAFVGALTGNFIFQKTWAFAAPDRRSSHAQLVQFVAVNLFNLALNTALLYVLVDRTGLSYFLSQTISSGTIAVGSYCAYQWIFGGKLRHN